jgi:hypothetical protein
VFTSSGTFTAPSGVTHVLVEAWGGGGGGTGRGFGGPGCAGRALATVAAGQAYTVTVGAGGSSNPPSPGNGTDSTFTASGHTIFDAGGGKAGGGSPGHAGACVADAATALVLSTGIADGAVGRGGGFNGTTAVNGAAGLVVITVVT